MKLIYMAENIPLPRFKPKEKKEGILLPRSKPKEKKKLPDQINYMV